MGLNSSKSCCTWAPVHCILEIRCKTRNRAMAHVAVHSLSVPRNRRTTRPVDYKAASWQSLRSTEPRVGSARESRNSICKATKSFCSLAIGAQPPTAVLLRFFSSWHPLRKATASIRSAAVVSRLTGSLEAPTCSCTQKGKRCALITMTIAQELGPNTEKMERIN